RLRRIAAAHVEVAAVARHARHARQRLEGLEDVRSAAWQREYLLLGQPRRRARVIHGIRAPVDDDRREGVARTLLRRGRWARWGDAVGASAQCNRAGLLPERGIRGEALGAAPPRLQCQRQAPLPLVQLAQVQVCQGDDALLTIAVVLQ